MQRQAAEQKKTQKLQEKKQRKKIQAARGVASKVVASGMEVKSQLQRQMQDPDLWMLPNVIKKKAEKALKDLQANLEAAENKCQDDDPAPYPEHFVSEWPTVFWDHAKPLL